MSDDPISEDLDDLGGDTVECPNCGEEVYDQANRCPHCGEYIVIGGGEPLNKGTMKNGRIIFIVLVVIAAIVMMLSILGPPSAL